jgi:Cysteine-rich CPCC
MNNIKYACPCCGYKTIVREDTFYDLCPVCFWETDPYQLANPTYSGGANSPSLTEAQQNFILFGACEKEDLPKTRQPLADEPKAENWLTLAEQKTENLCFKRHWNEASGDPKTNDWGSAFYYFETDKQGDVLKQIIVYENDKILKYSDLYTEDEFGGLTDQALDLTDSGYIAIPKTEFFGLWNIPIMLSFSKQKIHLCGWHLAVFEEKIIQPSPIFTEEQMLLSATLDHRFSLDLSFETNAKFVLKVKEGNTWIHFFNYINWAEAVAATQKWINETQAANKIVDAQKTEEAQEFSVRVSIENQVVMSRLTTWRNMDWEIEKWRNIAIKIGEETFSIIDTFTDFENMLLALQNSMPENYRIETCFFCRFSGYHPVGNDNFGALDCFKHCKADFVKVNAKNPLFDLYEKEKKQITKVNETDYCAEFVWIEKTDWAFKRRLVD